MNQILLYSVSPFVIFRCLHFFNILICIFLMIKQVKYICFGHMLFKFSKIHVVLVTTCNLSHLKKTKHLSIPMGHKSRQGLASSSAQSFTMQSDGQPAFSTGYLKLGKSSFPSSSTLLAFFILYDYRTEGLGSQTTVRGRHLQSLEVVLVTKVCRHFSAIRTFSEWQFTSLNMQEVSSTSASNLM